MKLLWLKKNLYLPALAVAGFSVIFGAFSGPGGTAPRLLYIAGLSSLIWLCWYWLKLSSQIESMQGRACACASRADELEKHVEDLQIQARLSQRQKHNAEAIIYSIRDAVVVTDGFDKLLMANERAGKLFGFDMKDSQRKPIEEVIEHGEFVQLVRQSRQSKAGHIKRELAISQGNDPKTFECIISCVHIDDDEVCGVVAVLHDITREKEVSLMKNEFISHVSHELKTPLTSISAYAEMLVDGEADDEQTAAQFCSAIQTQAARLSGLIEDILDISRIESGLIKINKEAVSAAMLIKEAVETMKSCAAEKNVKLIEQSPIVCDQIYADRDMVLRAIINLLSNAVKYTNQAGAVKIEACVDEADEVVRVSISDTGVGIPQDQIEHVFDKFYRVEENNKCATGTGLGLNLVKQIVEKVHNGRVFVTSKPDEGSTFGFELPLAKAAAEVV